jgi:hypothetical protein
MNGDHISVLFAHHQSLAAVSMAIDVLIDLGRIIFDLEQEDMSRTPESVIDPIDKGSLSWLQHFARRGLYVDSCSAYRTVFAWVSTVPTEYFDLLQLPVLRQAQLCGQSHTKAVDVDRSIKLLAWKIWAHSLVFAMLIECNMLWIGKTGTAGIDSLMALLLAQDRKLEETSGAIVKDDWWLGNMCLSL